jgi:glutathione S-transferase
MFCEKVRIVLALKNIPYEVVDVKKDDRKSLIEYSAQRKVPVMDYQSQCIIDSTYICALLEEKYPENSIYPSGASDKGLCLMLEDWCYSLDAPGRGPGGTQEGRGRAGDTSP